MYIYIYEYANSFFWVDFQSDVQFILFFNETFKYFLMYTFTGASLELVERVAELGKKYDSLQASLGILGV